MVFIRVNAGITVIWTVKGIPVIVKGIPVNVKGKPVNFKRIPVNVKGIPVNFKGLPVNGVPPLETLIMAGGKRDGNCRVTSRKTDD